MNRKPVLIVAATLLLCAPALAQGCAKGQGDSLNPLWDGYVAQIGPSPVEPGTCRASILAPDGSTVFSVSGPNAQLDPATGSNITNDPDGKRDVVLETDSGPDQCCHVYSIVIPGATPALQRQFSTSVELSFGDRDGDGKIEIWARDFAFDGFERLSHDQSPFPLVVFRLRGGTLYNVSGAFWSDYEADITRASSQMTKKDLDDFTGAPAPTPPSGAGIGGSGKDKEKELGPEELRHRNEIEGLVLQIILANLYGGHGAEAWKYVDDHWPAMDRSRIRQAILKARMSGLLAEINRNPPPTAQRQ